MSLLLGIALIFFFLSIHQFFYLFNSYSLSRDVFRFFLYIFIFAWAIILYAQTREEYPDV